MVPPALGKLIVVAIGASMWVWMQAYVKIQVALHGEKILTPRHRDEPPEFKNRTFGTHRYVNITVFGLTKTTTIRVHYVTIGCNRTDHGTMLILLHGFLDFWYIWNRQIPTLGKEFCKVLLPHTVDRLLATDGHVVTCHFGVVAPDLRGYGLTTRPVDSAEYLMVNLVEDVRGLIKALNYQKRKVVLVGHDWGAMIAFCFATLHQEMIDKMIVINGMHPKAFSKQLLRNVKQMRMSWYMLPFRHPVVPEKYLIMNDFAFFDKIHKGFTKEEENAHKYMFSQNGSLTGAINYYRAFNNDSDQLNKFSYIKLNVPTLILWGERDAFLTKPVAKYNREWLTASSVVYYRRAGHWLLRECSKQVNERISRFAKTGNAFKPLSTSMRKGDTCSEYTTEGGSWWATLFPWLPLNETVPVFTGE